MSLKRKTTRPTISIEVSSVCSPTHYNSFGAWLAFAQRMSEGCIFGEKTFHFCSSQSGDYRNTRAVHSAVSAFRYSSGRTNECLGGQVAEVSGRNPGRKKLLCETQQEALQVQGQL
jgi:hypothetical protein